MSDLDWVCPAHTYIHMQNESGQALKNKEATTSNFVRAKIQSGIEFLKMEMTVQEETLSSYFFGIA